MNLRGLRPGTKTGDSLSKRMVRQFISHNCRFLIDGQPIATTKEEQIRKLEEELEAMKAKTFTKTSDAYGNGDTLEQFSMKHLNRTKNPDLMPCPRRPPKKAAKE
jgi:hypothetical protein